LTLQRKRARIAEKKKRVAKAKFEAAEYQKLLASRLKEQHDRRSESLAKRRSRLIWSIQKSKPKSHKTKFKNWVFGFRSKLSKNREKDECFGGEMGLGIKL